MAEFPLPDLQIWRSRKRVAIQIQLMNIHVSEGKYYCWHLVPKFGDVRDRQNWRLHPTDGIQRIREVLRWAVLLKYGRQVAKCDPWIHRATQGPTTDGPFGDQWIL